MSIQKIKIKVARLGMVRKVIWVNPLLWELIFIYVYCKFVLQATNDTENENMQKFVLPFHFYYKKYYSF